MASEIDPREVIFIPPQQLDKAEGEYRVAGSAWDDDGKLGDRLVWIAESDDSGRFEKYDQATHGQRYMPQIRATEEES